MRPRNFTAHETGSKGSVFSAQGVRRKGRLIMGIDIEFPIY